MSTKERFANVRQLIAEKRYEEARFILEDIGNTQAQEWLWRVDSLQGRHILIKRLKLLGLLVVLIVIAGGGVYILQQRTARATRDISACFDTFASDKLLDECIDAGGLSKFLAGS